MQELVRIIMGNLPNVDLLQHLLPLRLLPRRRPAHRAAHPHDPGGRIHPGKLLNVKFEGFDKIEDAFKLMDAKPKDLIKPYVLI